MARRLRWPLAIILILGGVAWAASEWLVATARTQVNQRLEERGLRLVSKSESWSLLGGLALNEASLFKVTDLVRPLVSLGRLDVDVLWAKSWAEEEAITRWRARDAALAVTDDEGRVDIESFTADFILQKGKMTVAQAGMKQGPLKIDLKGEVLMGPGGTSPKEPMDPNWRSLRSVLNTLNFRPGSEAFTITGDFSVDLRNQPVIWNADLRGEGQALNWRGLPMNQAVVEGQVSQGGLHLTCDLKLTKGSALVELTREGWEQTPLNMSGTLTDSAGRSDEFNGRYDGGARTVTITEIRGKADLLELARGYPALAEKVPAAVTVNTFPEILAKDFELKTGEQPPVWSLASVQFKTPASIAVLVRNKPVEVDNVTGQLSYQGGQWHFDGLKGRMLDGTFTLDGDFDGEKLSKADVGIKSLRLARLSPWLGEVSSGLEDSDLSMTYRGSICNDPLHSTGSGSLVLSNAPVVHIPLLEQTYALFPKLLPDRGRAGAGSFQVTFAMNKGVATIDPFKGRSEAMTVTAKGTVDLVNRRVEGHARANLRGIVGRITLPLSHILTDMEISGPLDDIRVSPEGPIGGAKNLIKGSAKAATGSVKLSGDILKAGVTLPFEALGMFGEK